MRAPGAARQDRAPARARTARRRAASSARDTDCPRLAASAAAGALSGARGTHRAGTTSPSVAQVQHAAVVDDVPADHGQHRADLLQVLVRHGEVVAVEDHQVGELAGLDRAELILLAQEPAVLARVEAEHFLARDLLTGVDRLPARVKDRKSTRLNSSRLGISYAVFCLKKKNASPVTNEMSFPHTTAPHAGMQPRCS